jgi:transcriptional regulator with XRE-family HTH domain
MTIKLGRPTAFYHAFSVLPDAYPLLMRPQGATMQLMQPEIIQILRRRCNMNQGALGAAAFDTSPESGRTKIKNIELGRQIPTHNDLEKMAGVLGVPVAALDPARANSDPAGGAGDDGIAIHGKVLALLPGADVYIEMLNKAVRLDDRELIAHIAEKLAGLLSSLAHESLSSSSASG